MGSNEIISVVNYYLDKLIEMKGNRWFGEIDNLMADPNQDPKEELRSWLPINSTVTDNEIAELENKITRKLPPDYIIFLKNKHFYELNISEASFCRHLVNTWKTEMSKMIFYGYPKEYLIDRGLIPFSDWSDWGLLCFNVNDKCLDDNFPVVLWDHESPFDYKHVSIDFRSLILKLDN